jgi:hypothetical protein
VVKTPLLKVKAAARAIGPLLNNPKPNKISVVVGFIFVPPDSKYADCCKVDVNLMGIVSSASN